MSTQPPTIDQVIATLIATVEATEGVEESAISLINSIPSLIDAAVAKAKLTPAQAQIVQDTFASLVAKSDALAAAVAANPGT